VISVTQRFSKRVPLNPGYPGMPGVERNAGKSLGIVYVVIITFKDLCFNVNVMFNVKCLCNAFFRCVRKIPKKRQLASSCLTVCVYVCLSAWNNSAPSARIFMKYDI
jgi:hypothetical protein